jgi:simple sugar transport system permease protein
MGLPVARSKVIVYALCGFCAAIAGLAFFIKDRGGSALRSRGMELDAIAVAVIGGTLLSGGIGGIPGTLIGLLTYAIIQAAMSRHSFPTGVDRIVIGALLLAFILLQKLLQFKRRA